MENEKGEMKNEIEKMYIGESSRSYDVVRELIWVCLNYANSCILYTQQKKTAAWIIQAKKTTQM